MTNELEGFVDRAIEEYFDENSTSEGDRGRFRFDRMRFIKTLEWLSSVDLQGKRVLELGGPSIASSIVRKYFAGNEFTNTAFDLRTKFPFENDSFDIILNMEVIEHICDIQYQHATTFTGVQQCLAECCRCLKPQGKMFMTTPNAASIWIIQRVLLNQPPWAYEYHFREFTVDEIHALIKAAGFTIIKTVTETVWHFWDFTQIENFLRKNKYSLENRGDNIFLLAEKPPR